MGTDAGFATRLRWWRERRGHSQLELSHVAEISQRHLSFLELGRTKPSRDMVLRLSAALDLPAREQNALLLAAGFAPVWRERALGAPEMSMVDRALDFMLTQQEPYPGFVVDRRWNLLRANKAGQRFVGFLTDSPPFVPDPARPINFADALVAPNALRPLIVNWREVVLYFIRSVRADALADGSGEPEALLKRLLAYRTSRRCGRALRSKTCRSRCWRCISSKARCRCGCSRHSPRSAPRTTSPRRRSASSASSRPTPRPTACSRDGTSATPRTRFSRLPKS